MYVTPSIADDVFVSVSYFFNDVLMFLTIASVQENSYNYRHETFQADWQWYWDRAVNFAM